VRFDDDLNVAIEVGEKPHQPLDGIFSKAPFEHPRHFWLGYAHELTGPSLGELAFAGQPINFRDDLSLQEMRIGIRQTKIGKNIAACHLNFDLGSHHFLSLLERSA